MEATRQIIEGANQQIMGWTDDIDPAFVWLGDLSGWYLDQEGRPPVLVVGHRCGYSYPVDDFYAANLVCQVLRNRDHDCRRYMTS